MQKFLGKILTGKVVSVHAGDNADLSKPAQEFITADIDGIVGDKHRGSARRAWKGEWEGEGTVRRNERQWSGVSVEELAHISERLDLATALTAETLGANLCVAGIAGFSLLPKGTMLVFPSGAALLVEEYNPPCTDMGAQLAARYTTRAGERLTDTAWLRPAAGRRGVVGVVEVPGVIRAGDVVEAWVYETPVIRLP